MRLKKSVKTVITIVIIIVILVLLGLLKNYFEKKDKVPENDPNLVGNTQGNIYNNGLFVEADGTVFFSNSYDNGAIYAMTPYQDNIRKITDANASFLNVAGDYIYYYSNTSGEQNGLGYVRSGKGFYRSSLDGRKTYSLAKAESDSMILVGNHLYYTAFTEHPTKKDQALVTVNSVTTANENEITVIPEHAKLGGYSNGTLYYTGEIVNHYLYAYNTHTGTYNQVLGQNMYLPIMSGEFIYFIDTTDNYKLKRYSQIDDSITPVTTERVDTYNIYGDMIYYQNVDKDEYALKRIYTDGTGLETVKSGVYCNINVTSEYVYFYEFRNPLVIYQTPTRGSVNVTTFDKASVAANENRNIK